MWEQQWGMQLPRPVCFAGDVCQPGLGLATQDRDWVVANCHSMMHSAASLTFHKDSSGEPYRSNVQGTQHVLDFCSDVKISDFHYVSTAYVCGMRTERVMECDLDLGQQFRNDYEHAKLQAEQIVRSADFLDKLTVYRPAVIAGDSQTGYTNTYHGLYMYLKLMSVLVRNTQAGPDGVRHTPVRLEMTGDEPRNIVPVDWVAAVMRHLYKSPEAQGKTFHLAPHTPLTPRQIIEAGYTYFNSRGVEFAGVTPDAEAPISNMDQNAHENMGMYKEYEGSDPEFDLTNLEEHAAHLPCPIIDEEMLHRFLKYGEADRWGKRRRTPPLPCGVEKAGVAEPARTWQESEKTA
jgi:nucleoside-diphosphate-sugar epimerase